MTPPVAHAPGSPCIHTSALGALEPLLRVYEGCGRTDGRFMPVNPALTVSIPALARFEPRGSASDISWPRPDARQVRIQGRGLVRARRGAGRVPRPLPGGSPGAVTWLS